VSLTAAGRHGTYHSSVVESRADADSTGLANRAQAALAQARHLHGVDQEALDEFTSDLEGLAAGAAALDQAVRTAQTTPNRQARVDSVSRGFEHLASCLQTLAEGRGPLSSVELQKLLDLLDPLRIDLFAVVALLAPAGQPDGLSGSGLDLLATVALAYGDDAANSRRVSATYRAAGAVLIVLAVGMALLSSTTDWFASPAGKVQSLSYQLGVAGFMALLAYALLQLSERSRRSADEHTRLQRHLTSLEPFLGQLPESMRPVVRAGLAPRVFARVLDDDDPTREPIWPTTAELLDVERLPAQTEDPPQQPNRLRWLGRLLVGGAYPK